MKKWSNFFLIILVLLLITGCSNRSEPSTQSNPVSIDLITDSKVRIDGEITTTEWKGIRSYRLSDQNYNDLTISTYLGEKGISIGAFVNSANTLNLIVTPDNVDSLNDKSLKLNIDSNGEVKQYRYSDNWVEENLNVMVKSNNNKFSYTVEVFIPWNIIGQAEKQEAIRIFSSLSEGVTPSNIDINNPSTYLRFNSFGFIKKEQPQASEIVIDSVLSEWYVEGERKYQGFVLEDRDDTGKTFTSQAFLGDDGLYVMADITHGNYLSYGNVWYENTNFTIKVGEHLYYVTNFDRSYGINSSMITEKIGNLYRTRIEVFIPLYTDTDFIRMGVAFTTSDDYIDIDRGVENVNVSTWWLNRHDPSVLTDQFFIYSDGMFEKIKNGSIIQKDTMGASPVGHLSTIGFNLENDEGNRPYIYQNSEGEQRVYFQKLYNTDYVISVKVKAHEAKNEAKPKAGLIVAENDKGTLAFLVDYQTNIHTRALFKETDTWDYLNGEVVNYNDDLLSSGTTLTAVRQGNTFYFFVNDVYMSKRVVNSFTDNSVAGFMTIGQAATFSEYYSSTDQSIIEKQLNKIPQKEGKTMLTIADSIFDFRDNSLTDMVQTIANKTGFDNLYIDNIGATTIAPLKNRGIVDHIDSGLYESYPDPELIIIERGTNDCAFIYNGQVKFGTIGNGDKTTTLGAIEYIANYFRTKYPNSRIIWTTPIYRANLPVESHQELINALQVICPKYNIEVFDLRTAVGINASNYTTYLYDGIHLNDAGRIAMENAFIEYLNGGE